MTPGDLETALRDCLVRGAAQVPASGESAADTVVLADRVLRRARTVRRRRATGGALSVVVVAAAAGVAIAGPGRQAPPPVPHVIAGGSETPQHVAASATPASPPAEPDIVPGTVRREQMASRGLPVDVVVGGRLRTTAGESIDVAGLGEVVAAYRVRDGWLVLGAPVRAGSSLWLVTEGADPRPVLRAVDTVVLAEDGVRLAWRAADRVHVGALVAGEVVATRALAAAGGVAPAAFVGSGVLLSKRRDGAVAAYAMWWPKKPRREPVWIAVDRVYGALPDDRTLVAQQPRTDRDGPCLVLLDATAALTVRQRACGLPLADPAAGWLSPNGRWLVVGDAAGDGLLVDVPVAFDDADDDDATGEGPASAGPKAKSPWQVTASAPAAIDGWRRLPAGASPSGEAVWADQDTAVYGVAGTLVRLRLDRLAAGQLRAVDRITVPTDDKQAVLPVARPRP